MGDAAHEGYLVWDRLDRHGAKFVFPDDLVLDRLVRGLDPLLGAIGYSGSTWADSHLSSSLYRGLSAPIFPDRSLDPADT